LKTFVYKRFEFSRQRAFGAKKETLSYYLDISSQQYMLILGVF
jgi:hypothetical protein